MALFPDLRPESEMKDPPEMCRALLSAASVAYPGDPVVGLKTSYVIWQRTTDEESVNCNTFVAQVQNCSTTDWAKEMGNLDGDGSGVCPELLEKADHFYRTKLTTTSFRNWRRYTLQSKKDRAELAVKMAVARKHFNRRMLQITFAKWANWVAFHRERCVAAVGILRRVVDVGRRRRIITVWHGVANKSKIIEEYFKKLHLSLSESTIGEDQIGQECDRVSMLPRSIAVKIFLDLRLRDKLNCAMVCRAWKSIFKSPSMWHQIYFSAERCWITDKTVKQVLHSHHSAVHHVSMAACASLTWTSIELLTKCKHLLDLNLSETNVTDMMMQKIVDSCPFLHYVNVARTCLTDRSLRELARDGMKLLRLNLGYCKFTDEGFQYLTSGTGCQNLFHLNLSGCSQMTANAFRAVAVGCPFLKQLVMDDMPTLSDRCLLELLEGGQHLSAISMLDNMFLSDVSVKVLCEAASWEIFVMEGNSQVSDISWKVLCHSSHHLKRLRASEFPRMTDKSLHHMAALKHLQFLDISHSHNVTDAGIKWLTDGCTHNSLQELIISHCRLITDKAVMWISQRMTKLVFLNVSYCWRLTDISLEWLSGSSITNLDISGCHIQDQGLIALEGAHWKKLTMAKCEEITDIGIEGVCKNVKELEYFDMSHCPALTDEAVRAVSYFCKKLFTLHIKGCMGLTDRSVDYLSRGCAYLRELDVSGCVLLKDHTLTYLQRMTPPLSHINMNCCSISRIAALRLQPKVEFWAHSNDYPPHWP